jgi:DNA replication and repair protein RecF
LILSRLQTENFRNLEATSIEFHPRTNLIVGRNGQGKTNLLEAIYFVATTKSFRTSRIANVVQFGTETIFALGALKREVERTLSVGMDIGERKRRILMINGERIVLHTYLDAMTVFAYSSARLEILRGGPEERRRFLDRGVASIDQGYLASVNRFGRVLKQRNALLQTGSPAGIEAWDGEFIEASGVLQTARARYVDLLRDSLQALQREFHVRTVDMQYRPSTPDLTKRREELRAGMSLSGPQRDHLDFTIEGRPAHEVLSGGEQKMNVLLMKYAKLSLFRERRGEDAIFVLDDLDAELDIEILARLLSRLPAETQVFATSAKERLIGELADGPHRRLTIENGRVTSSQDFG